MATMIGEVVFISPHCKHKFEVGKIVVAGKYGYVLSMWGHRKHPLDHTTQFRYGQRIDATKRNCWHIGRLQEAQVLYLERESKVRG